LTGKIIRVPEDYPTIQEAIDVAGPGYTILVSRGNYRFFATLVINKPISLIGEDKRYTIIGGLATKEMNAISIYSSNVTIRGFTIEWNLRGAGIVLHNVSNCVISDNIIARNEIGLLLISSNNNTIRNNEILLNHGGGVLLKPCSNGNVIVNNTIKWNGGLGGIFLWSNNDYNIIECNRVLSNAGHGIKLLDWNDYNVIRNNYIKDNQIDGIYLARAENNTIIHNKICSNGHGIALHDHCRNNRIIGNVLVSNRDGDIHMEKSSGSLVKNNLMYHNYFFAVAMFYSNNNTIRNNFISMAGTGGMYLVHSNYNRIFNNTILKNDLLHTHANGIWLIDSNYNEIAWNNIWQNGNGLRFSGNSTENVVRENNIEGNRGGIENNCVKAVNVTYNWWGDSSGPYDPITNPRGKGNGILGKALFEPWLTSPVKDVAKPPKLVVSNITISPGVVYVGQTFNILVSIVNLGDLPGLFKLCLKINNTLESTSEVVLFGRTSSIVVFNVTKHTPSKYVIEVNGTTKIINIQSIISLSACQELLSKYNNLSKYSKVIKMAYQELSSRYSKVIEIIYVLVATVIGLSIGMVYVFKRGRASKI